MKPESKPIISREADPMLRNELEKQLLKYTAGRLMTCPGCGELMDCVQTTVFSVYGLPGGKEPEKIVASFVQCSKCWDKRGAASMADITKLASRKPELKIRTELVDGREVFGLIDTPIRWKKGKRP